MSHETSAGCRPVVRLRTAFARLRTFVVRLRTALSLMPRPRRPVATVSAVLCCLILAGAVNRDREPVELQLHTVKPTEFRTEIKVEGRVEPFRAESVSSGCRYPTRILKIAAEGTWVKKGDVVCELDSADYEDYLHKREVPLIRARATHDAAVQDENLLQAANERRQSKAQFLAQSATSALEEYQSGSYPMSLAKLEDQLTILQDQLYAAEDEMRFIENLWSQGMANDRALHQAAYDLQLKRERARKSEADIFMLNRFTHPRTELQMTFRDHDAQRNLLRTEISNSLAQTKARLSTLASEQRVQIYNRLVKDTRANIEACTLRAPRDGQLMYENSWSDLSRGRVSIEEGRTVYFQQPIFAIPNLSNLKVVVPLHESLIRQVSVGMAVVVHVKGYENDPIAGELVDISDYPKPRSYYTPEILDYSMDVLLKPTDAQREFLRLKSDTVVSIPLSQRDDALLVPREAIVGCAGVNYVWRLTDNELTATRVSLGACDDVFACVNGGLESGDRVALQLSIQQTAALQEYVDSAIAETSAVPSWRHSEGI